MKVMPTDSARILVIDDEFEIREMLDLNLRLRGHAVRTAADGVEGLSLVRDWHPDVIILDVVMPKVDGFTLLPALRRLTEAPVIMLTAKGDVMDRVRGLEGGADDYIAKPFEMAELIARLQTRLRRPSLDRRTQLSFDDLTMDLQTYIVTRAAQRIDLSAREFTVLATLMRHPGQVFTRDQLFSTVWGDNSDAEVGIVDRTISNIRAKVDQTFDKKLIQTIRGVGYAVRE